MSHARVRQELVRFLSNAEPEVLSISGRWGVGKTYAWDLAINDLRSTVLLSRYAYVSAFGLTSIDSLTTAIVQSTVRLDAPVLEPTIESFSNNLKSVKGLLNFAEQGARKGVQIAGKVASAVPYSGKAADLFAPGAALLIRNQIICIDDIERAGKGLDVADIFGLVSSLRERKGCKIVLLLNEEGLGESKAAFREYLEKAVDQAISFEPTPQESVAAALDKSDPLSISLGKSALALGITNVRVIKRIRRFLSFIEPRLSGVHEMVIDRVVQSMTLLGWSVFEPKLAPSLATIRSNKFTGDWTSQSQRTKEELADNALLSAFNFTKFEDVDELILAGLQAGGFEDENLAAEFASLNERFKKGTARYIIENALNLYQERFDQSERSVIDSLISCIKTYSDSMYPTQVTDALNMLRQLDQATDAERLVKVYIEAHKTRPREFFERANREPLLHVDPAIREAFKEIMYKMPLERDPADILRKVAQTNGWTGTDSAFLVSLPVERYVDMIKKLNGADLHAVVGTALQFSRSHNAGEESLMIGDLMTKALRQIKNESRLNAMLVARYLGNDVEDALTLAENTEV